MAKTSKNVIRLEKSARSHLQETKDCLDDAAHRIKAHIIMDELPPSAKYALDFLAEISSFIDAMVLTPCRKKKTSFRKLK